MRRAWLVLLLASCLLDPKGVLDNTQLTVRAFNLPADGGSLAITTIDARAKTRNKKTPVRGETMDILYEAGALAEGEVVVSAELFDTAQRLIGCGTARGVVGVDAVLIVGFASPDTSDFTPKLPDAFAPWYETSLSQMSFSRCSPVQLTWPPCESTAL